MSVETYNEPQSVIAANREAFGEIVRRYQDMVSAVTFSMTGNLQQSEDLTQETFVAAWQNQRELRDPAKLPAWLCGIARNLTRNWLRRTEQERRMRSSESLDEIPDALPGGATHPNPAGKLEREEQAALLWATLAQIPETYREPLVMYYRRNQAVAEIAAALETSEDNVRQRLVRGRAYLKDEVRQLVESALETLRPDTTFTVAVLAALPAVVVPTAVTAATLATAATATTGSVTATGSIAATGSATATGGSGVVGKGLGLAGIGTLAWLVGVIWLALISVVLPIVALYAGLMGKLGPLQQIRNSPTVRSRRFMMFQGQLTAAVAIFLMGTYFFAMSFPNERLSVTTKVGLVVFLAWLFFVNIMFGAIYTNKYWRKIIEQDLGRLPAPKRTLEQSWLSVRSLRCNFAVTFVLLASGIFGILWFQWLCFQNIPNVFVQCAMTGFGLLIMLFVPVFFVVIHVRGMRMASDEGLEKYPPTIPNILDVVLHKAEMPQDKSTLRARMGGDMIGMGVLTGSVSASPTMFGLMQPNPWVGYVIIAVTVIGFVLFARFIAGKPKVRHLGWAATCFFYMFFYGWIHWFALREPLARFPEMQLAVLFAYALFLIFGLGGVVGYVGLFEKEINKKWGVLPKESPDEKP
ncbi:MAG: sigma-70 family RNA polymerase sigma factor [Planctomycetaceae bacterium]|nr:sigma-70 family RNA polymerase sigma factor [Planctomycetaceae bacterium]